MTKIALKRVYDDYSDQDGYRVLVDRLWPRGVKKEHLHYDLWAKDITPSTELRKTFHENKEEMWSLFEKKYVEELSNSQAVKDFIQNIKKYPKVTLLYAAKDPVHNHAIILKKYLDKELGNS